MLAGVVWRRRAMPGAVPFALLLLAAGEWAGMAALEHAVVSPAAKVFFARLAASWGYLLNLLGAVTLVPALVRFPRQYRPQSVALVAGLVIPWIGNGIYLGGLLTGWQADRAKVENESRGVAVVIEKPVTLDALRRAIGQLRWTAG